MIVESVPEADELRDHWWWRPGWHPGSRFLAWHLTFEAQAGLHRAVRAYQDALAPFDALDPVPVRWLHLTMAGIGHLTDLPTDRPASIVASAERWHGRLVPPTLSFSRVLVLAESVCLVPDQVDELANLADALTGDVPGSAAARGFLPHLSLAYVNGPQPGAPVVDALKDVAVQRLSGVAPTLSLIELHRDNRVYEWRTLVALA